MNEREKRSRGREVAKKKALEPREGQELKYSKDLVYMFICFMFIHTPCFLDYLKAFGINAD